MMSKVSSGSTGGARKRASNDAVHEVEQQFILRMPMEVATQLHNEVSSGSPALIDNLSIEMLPDMRHALIRYGHYIYNAKLVDLPCIIESLKTIDRKTFYKTADISQMLICTEDDDSGVELQDSTTKKDKDRKYMWTHGITPPLKNVRKRRFRKTLTKKYNEQPDIEKEVRQLFRMDVEAVEVKWELVAEESGKSLSPTEELSQMTGPDTGLQRNMTNTSLADIDLFGELSSSDEDSKDVNVIDSGEEGAPNQSSRTKAATVETLEISSKERELMQARIGNLAAELEGLRNERLEQESQMATVDSPTLQQHYQGILDKLMEEENEKESEYQMLMSIIDGRKVR